MFPFNGQVHPASVCKGSTMDSATFMSITYIGPENVSGAKSYNHLQQVSHYKTGHGSAGEMENVAGLQKCSLTPLV